MNRHFFLLLLTVIVGCRGSVSKSPDASDEEPSESSTDTSDTTTDDPVSTDSSDTDIESCDTCVTSEDVDGDGILDEADNCDTVSNPDQEDADGDLVGDECDNCPAVANFDQADSNDDGIGDACPMGEDADDDGVTDTKDNCPTTANKRQEDADGDGVGDECDNCPLFGNASQLDSNDDGVGDVCTTAGPGDPDEDGIREGDNCPLMENPTQDDNDTDGVGDACDNCPGISNPFQEDADRNGTGDHCEPEFRLSPEAPVCASGSSSGVRLAANIYILLDLSTSMLWEVDSDNTAQDIADSRWGIVTEALDGVAGELASNFNVGVGGFPARCENQSGSYNCQDTPSACSDVKLPEELLPMQSDRDGALIQGAYSTVTPFGTTPTAQALTQTLEKRLFDLPEDTYAGQRANAVVLITDGDPNSTGNTCNTSTDIRSTEDAARALADANVPVYVIGIAGVNESNMERIAAAGGGENPTDRNRSWYPASDVVALADALREIAASTVGCTMALTSKEGETPDFERASVVFYNGDAEGETISRDEWQINQTDVTTLALIGDACDNVRDATDNGKEVSVEVRVACAGTCGDEEICSDGIDNNCNGVIDEDCDDSCICIFGVQTCNGDCPDECVPQSEQCDGEDNDCDGQIDEGCCEAEEEVCDGIDNDCDGRVDEGCGSSVVV